MARHKIACQNNYERKLFHWNRVRAPSIVAAVAAANVRNQCAKVKKNNKNEMK